MKSGDSQRIWRCPWEVLVDLSKHFGCPTSFLKCFGWGGGTPPDALEILLWVKFWSLTTLHLLFLLPLSSNVRGEKSLWCPQHLVHQLRLTQPKWTQHPIGKNMTSFDINSQQHTRIIFSNQLLASKANVLFETLCDIKPHKTFLRSLVLGFIFRQ